MILAIEIGNTKTAFGVFENKILKSRWSIGTSELLDSNDLYRDIVNSFENNKIVSVDVEGIILSSVVPNLTKKLKLVLERVSSKVLQIGDKDIKIDIDVKINNPDKLGADILINMLMAKDKFSKHFTVIDMGTATTFDTVDKNGAYIGSVIVPGIQKCADTLNHTCALLPRFQVKKQDNIIGKNTIEAMNSGVYFGYIGLVKEIVDRIKKEQGEDLKVYLTGGASEVIREELESSGVIDGVFKNLTLEGLMLVWYMNQ